MARVAQGSGSAEWMVVGVLVAVHCCSLLASSATLTVGGAPGWTIGPNYANWVANQTFAIGDVLFFSYVKGSHNVVEVNKTDYDACSATSAIATYTDGNTSVSLASAGSRYFLCSYPSHCTSGMHLAVTVGAGATPAPAPTTTVGTPPPTPATPTAPAPSPTSATPPPTPTAPVPSPVSVGTPVPSASAPAPTPASTPSPTPAPTSLSPSPVSGPTPASPSTPASAASPPSPGSPSSTTGTPPPSSAPYRPSAASLAAVILGLGGALLAL